MKINVNKFLVGDLIEVTNNSGMTIVLSSCGAGIKDVIIPDKDNQRVSVTLSPYLENEYVDAYHGKTIGRTSGRIENATFEIDGKTALLEKNNFGFDNLHGGSEGFHFRDFKYDILENNDHVLVEFRYNSPNGEGGYFGNVNLLISYKIFNNKNSFSIYFDADTDTKTLLNLTNHVYWNLSGDLKDTVLNHKLFLNADKYGLLDERFIVRSMPDVTKEFDFTNSKFIGEDVFHESVQINTLGYDHPFFLKQKNVNNISASLYCPNTKIKLNVYTTYPVVVVYSNNLYNDDILVKENLYDKKYLAVCLECQYHPDGIHQIPADCGIFDPLNPYHNETHYEFVIE